MYRRPIAIAEPGGVRFMPFARVEAFMAALQDAAALDTIRQIVDAEVQALGFDCYAYVQLRPPKGVHDRLYFSSYPAEWMRHYAQHDLRLHDPLWGQALTTIQPFLWQDVKMREPSTIADALVYGPGADVGLRAGAGIPLHGPQGAVATLQVAKDCDAAAFRALFEAQRHLLQLIAHNIHARVIDLALRPVQAPTAALSPRQKDVLLWTIRGKTNWEIGELLHISEDTVRQHMIKICRLLGASNRAQAAVIAVLRGLVIP